MTNDEAIRHIEEHELKYRSWQRWPFRGATVRESPIRLYDDKDEAEAQCGVLRLHASELRAALRRGHGRRMGVFGRFVSRENRKGERKMKYSLIETDAKERLGRTLFRIQAEKAFGSVRRGELGGYIEAEENLDQSGDAWVYGDAQVSGNARVYGNARVSGDAQVYGGFAFGFRADSWVVTEVAVQGGVLLVGNYAGEAR